VTGTLEPLSRESSASIIADQLRSGIMDGLFAPGQQMGEVQLAQQLGVSRGLLREAMQRLVQEGLLRSERYRGLFVIDLDTEDVWDIYLAREAIERAAVRTLMRKATPRSLESLSKIVRQMEAAGRRKGRPSLAELDLRFHAELVEASGSARLRRVMQALLVETRMCQTKVEGRYQHSAELVAEHREIYEALLAGDEARALELTTAHMSDAISRLGAGTAGAGPEHGKLA
jgi:DNA-binding GntR family transcriptional regulator